MPLYDFRCEKCSHKFEQITSSDPAGQAECPKCGSSENKRLVSRFKVGGRGDLRESTTHGCHGCHSGHNHSHSSGGSGSEPGESSE